jgi:hypothetical protein
MPLKRVGAQTSESVSTICAERRALIFATILTVSGKQINWHLALGCMPLHVQPGPGRKRGWPLSATRLSGYYPSFIMPTEHWENGSENPAGRPIPA